MPITTRSNSVSVENSFKSVSKNEWSPAEALLFLKYTPVDTKRMKSVAATRPTKEAATPSTRPHRMCATYTAGTFTGMEE